MHDPLRIFQSCWSRSRRSVSHQRYAECRFFNHFIKNRIEQVETAIKAVKNDLIAQLPKIPRTGKVVTDTLIVELVSVHHDTLAVA